MAETPEDVLERMVDDFYIEMVAESRARPRELADKVEQLMRSYGDAREHEATRRVMWKNAVNGIEHTLVGFLAIVGAAAIGLKVLELVGLR